jgi:hypothetical protein
VSCILFRQVWVKPSFFINSSLVNPDIKKTAMFLEDMNPAGDAPEAPATEGDAPATPATDAPAA